MPAPRRAILTDISELSLNPKKKLVLGRDGRLIQKNNSSLLDNKEEIKAEIEIPTLEVVSKEETIELNNQSLSNSELVTEVETSVVEQTLIPDPEVQVELPKSKSVKGKQKKKVQ